MRGNIKWGILATGHIAHKFASDLQLVEDAELVAVASRNIDKGVAFAKRYGAKTAYGSYEELIEDKNVEVIYIATPHTLHYENTMRCLEAGKNVLCEKPLGMNSKQVSEMIRKAKEKGLFLMEALWTRFIPSYLKFREIALSGVIGDIKLIQSDFGYVAPENPEGRLLNKSLGGGALLDIGIYPVFLALDIAGNPDYISAEGILNSDEIDETCGIIFKYSKNGIIADLNTTLFSNTPVESTVFGTRGNVKLNRMWHVPSSIVLQHEDGYENFTFEKNGNGYEYEIMEVNQCLRNGKIQSESLNFEKSIEIHYILDNIRKQIGLVYDADK